MAEVLLEDAHTNMDTVADPLELKLLRAALLDEDDTEKQQPTVSPTTANGEVKNVGVKKSSGMLYVANVIGMGITAYILIATVLESGPISEMFGRISNKVIQLVVRIVAWALLTFILVTLLLGVPS